MEKIRLFFDTNVLVYAHDESSLFHEESASLLDLAVEKKIHGVISEQNIMELYRVLTNPSAMVGKPLRPLEVKALIEKTYLERNFEIIYPTKLTLTKTIDLAIEKNSTSAKIFDMRLSAHALDAHVDYFATYNVDDFKDIEGLNPLTPKEILFEIDKKEL
ncbi:MAG TPA: PIN domain-containing protein [Candidatus Desulfofervidus auxilii]|uniref:PIN domain-containing protein n=1 Tax=Desulfofervidus auxilii TaxID=1621989 RepID=A0A7C1ZE58_DESA2|nr:PIN domain-containing protein [Candidatus Desulfofervidus auxilii]